MTGSADGTARVWDAVTGLARTGVLRHQGETFDAQFSPDGKLVLTASLDGSARLWDAETGLQRALLTHSNELYGAEFSHDGRWVATASKDRTARIWSVRSGQPVVAFRGHTGEVFCARFDPTGSRVISASSDRTEDTLRRQAPSIYASGPMSSVSPRYTFVPTAEIVTELRGHDWVPVEVEEQRIRTEARRGFQKHPLRFRRAEQMETLDEWNVELVLVNSHDAGCAYQLHAGIYRRICSNGLVMSNGSFNAIRFRHAGLLGGEIVQASLRVLEFIPRVGELVQKFRDRSLGTRESLSLAQQALLLRYPTVEAAPVSPDTLLKARRPEDEGTSVWATLNRLQVNLIQGGVSDWHRDKRGKLRSVRMLRGIDSKVTLNKALWGLAERVANGEALAPVEDVVITA